MSGQATSQITNTAISAGVPIAIAAAKGLALTVPVVGAVIAGVTLAVNMWLSKIAKQNAQKTATTHIVDEAEPLLKQNVNAFMSLAAPTESEQLAALQNFDAIWAQVVDACSHGGFDAAGQRCVSDRQRGGQWDWFSYYRTPIENREVVSDAFGTGDGSASGGLLSALGLGSNGMGLLLPLLLIGGGLLIASGDSR